MKRVERHTRRTPKEVAPVALFTCSRHTAAMSSVDLGIHLSPGVMTHCSREPYRKAQSKRAEGGQDTTISLAPAATYPFLPHMHAKFQPLSPECDVFNIPFILQQHLFHNVSVCLVGRTRLVSRGVKKGVHSPKLGCHLQAPMSHPREIHRTAKQQTDPPPSMV